MSFLCSLIGHRTPKGWNNKPSYLKPVFVAVDGTDIIHFALHAICVQCSKEYVVGYMHMPKMPEWMSELLIDPEFMRENRKLREAAQAVIDRWDTPLWKDVPATAEYIGRLRAALGEKQ